MSRSVGVIGLGAMGQGVADNLIKAGLTVYGCDLRREVLDGFAARGGKASTSPAMLGAQCDVVIVLVVNSAQTDSVLFGENGAVQGMKRGSVVVSSATVQPSYAAALGKRLGEKGIELIDAPVSGGVVGAAKGTAYQMFAAACAAGLGHEDDTAVIKTFPGIKLPGV